MLNQTEISILNLEGRNRLNLTCVDTVDGFSEQMLRITVKGDKTIILGENIKITAFNKATGSLSAEGVFNEIKFAAKKVPLLKKFLK